ncbi:MAG: type I-C CRISPR-associated protein Cas8c/Csd1 [Eubacteriales bacterium]|nr:type I-C CRISPR-associated protein Cas8c/Csd1 [Eubacteriales bacterium]
MNWIAALCDLYDKKESVAGIMIPDQPVFLPVYHTTVAAQLTVTIDGNGNFLYAEVVPEEDKRTIIPVTEKSASRTAGIEPHPLCDNLKYLSGDYNRYVAEKDCSKNYGLYMEQLEKWVNSPYTHEKVNAIYQYLKKGTLMRDLCEHKVLVLEEDGSPSVKAKIQIVSQVEAFVRFRIETGELPPEDMLEDESGRYFAECWKDRTLQQSYIAYCNSQEGKTGLSYLTGNIVPISYLHPKKIRNEGDGAKLISSNDETYYTYRGRFQNKEEAFAIGYEDSQKVHNALKWVIRKYGSNYGSMKIVTWESELCRIPDWKSDSDSICRDAEENFDSSWMEETENENADDTDEAGVARFKSALRGYEKNLSRSSRTIIMAFDAATPGRLAMMECKDYQSSRYIERLEDWYRRCEWRQEAFGKERGRYSYLGMVGIEDAAELLYGTEQNGFFSMKGKEDYYKEVAKRWMPCILDGRAIPKDMVWLAVRRASSPVSFKSRFLWQRVLGLACSMVKQQYEKEYKEVWTVALDETCTRRDYLYGRLLALADRIEYRTYDKDDGRETNAKRYMCAFSQHPFRTWKVIEEKLEPYWNRLNAAERLVYQRQMNEIYNQFSIGDFEGDAPLSGLYLLGFHSQAYALQKKKDKEEEQS